MATEIFVGCYCVVLSLFFINIHAPPVDVKKTETTTLSPEEIQEQEIVSAYGVEYEKYLREIVSVLESDSEFKRKIENASQEDIRSGKIAEELDFVNETIRSKLDEIKRNELERIKDAMEKQQEFLDYGEKIDFPSHLNSHGSFKIEDLKKLIIKATEDFERIDEERKENFKKHELKKKYEQEEKYEKLQGEDLTKAKLEDEKLKQKHAEHPDLNHPMSKDQYKEVWENEDNMAGSELNLETFFKLHDLNGNGFLEEDEIKALLQGELDKAYNNSLPEDDPVERKEEMERMREHVMKEVDLDKDMMISFEEFMANTKRKEYEQDPGWDTLEKQTAPYSDEEYKKFENEMENLKKMHGSPPSHSPLGDQQVPLTADHQPAPVDTKRNSSLHDDISLPVDVRP